ncbi:MAG: hypothetical protein JW936_06980 [Sedimentisphaerales bacterium]|nr:hypothetical protein [Sedimentisphaerales bacterium]
MDKPRIGSWVRVVAVSLAAIVIFMGVMTLQHYIAYELFYGVGRLRASVGERVVIPAQSVRVMGETISIEPRTGILRRVGYRFNGDSLVFF